MKLVVASAMLCIAIVPLAVAQTGGYPASPSHGVVGTSPDGTPRYGNEPAKGANRSPDTVGRGNSATPDDHNPARRGDQNGVAVRGKN